MLVALIGLPFTLRGHDIAWLPLPERFIQKKARKREKKAQKPAMSILRSRGSSSLLYSSIPSKSFSFLCTVTWRLSSGLALSAAAAA